MQDHGNWDGKVAIVTGGSSGIGEAVAVALAHAGARVAITGRNPERLDAVADRHDRVMAIRADSAVPESAERVVQTVMDAWGRIDLLVNNAGAGSPIPIDAYDEASIRMMCAVNIIGPSLLVKASARPLRASRGAIVNIATAASRNSAPGLGHYAATKLALEHLTRSWAVELAGDGVRANAVSPGPTRSGALTGMMGLPKEVARNVEIQEASQVPLGRRGEPSDIAPWVLRLGHPDNDWLTGQVLTIDGGWSMRG